MSELQFFTLQSKSIYSYLPAVLKENKSGWLIEILLI